MLRTLVLSFLLATPAMAADDPLDLFALALAGLADGASGQVAGTGPLERRGPGVYRGTPADGTEFRFAVTTAAPCVFEVVAGLGEMKPVHSRIDLSQVTAISVSALQDDRFRVSIDGPPGLAQTEVNGRWLPVANTTEYETSVSLAELQAGAAALREACAKPG
jgi:hypothetical protein